VTNFEQMLFEPFVTVHTVKNISVTDEDSVNNSTLKKLKKILFYVYPQ